MQHQRLVDRVLAEKAASGMTMAKLSRKMGLSNGQLSNIVNGAVPGLKLCRHLAAYFGVSLEYMLFLAGHVEETPREHGLAVDRMARMVSQIGDEGTRHRAVRAATAVIEAFLNEHRANN